MAFERGGVDGVKWLWKVCMAKKKNDYLTKLNKSQIEKFLNICINLIYTSQQKKRYKSLMLNIVYIEKKNRQKSYNLNSYGHSK